MEQFLTKIYRWYEANKRDLPWRRTSNPYYIWVAEIILQQTRVQQGLEYYRRFTDRFPTIAALANAPEGDVLKIWQGLGYYSRARNLQLSSRIIMERHSGKFPSDYKEILKLKGVGEYTAAAIASIAFNQPFAAVDGNIARVLSRYYKILDPVDSGIGKRKIKGIAENILNRKSPGKHNQALMEFGALQCIPSNPVCEECPVNDNCLAYIQNLVDRIPVKSTPPKQKKRYFYYFLIEENESVYLHQRNGNDIWKYLYEFPMVETDNSKSVAEVINSALPELLHDTTGCVVTDIRGPVLHILSHQKITAHFIRINKKSINKLSPPLIRINKKDIPKFAVPRLIEKYLSGNGFIV